MVICSLLEGHGIVARLENQNAGFAAIGFPTPISPVRIIVPASQAADAAEIVKEAMKRHTSTPQDRLHKRRMWLSLIALDAFMSVLTIPLLDGWQLGLGIGASALMLLMLFFAFHFSAKEMRNRGTAA